MEIFTLVFPNRENEENPFSAQNLFQNSDFQMSDRPTALFGWENRSIGREQTCMKIEILKISEATLERLENQNVPKWMGNEL